MHASIKTILRPLLKPVRTVMQSMGYDIAQHVPADAGSGAGSDPRLRWIEKLNVDLLLDVGANEGQYVAWTRGRGYRGPIISFEPQRKAFAVCQARCAKDPNWIGINTALGETNGDLTLHVAGNSMSSSLRPMLHTHVDALPESAIIADETVPVQRLDEVVAPLLGEAKSVYLKIDTQGFELQVLRGARGLLERVSMLELELSLVPLYGNQELLPEVWIAVEELGFEPVWVEQGFCDATECRMLQIDALFVSRAEKVGRCAQ